MADPATALARANRDKEAAVTALTGYQSASTSAGASLAAFGSGFAARAMSGASIPLGRGGVRLPVATLIGIAAPMFASSEICPADARPYVGASGHGFSGAAGYALADSIMSPPPPAPSSHNFEHPRA